MVIFCNKQDNALLASEIMFSIFLSYKGKIQQSLSSGRGSLKILARFSSRKKKPTQLHIENACLICPSNYRARLDDTDTSSSEMLLIASLIQETMPIPPTLKFMLG